ncbi:MAG: L,D-transpeptidase family protein [Sulfitobacter litoralis]|jgi:murein L,D-transpeptidase YcbB/YkuD|uniref:L,D-transpeptidase family protein n=1 Tax=Sulfitobacter TaxID=60136 RepID=UPI001B5EB00E|nr:MULTISPECIES: L,D-transpeptidase family protein [Sulfitobacter]MBQ0767259.1 L,D-transpeptidase family protein [Sulfitobacter litoralis]MCF7725835.1 L,D-transpeptidase family protein [Sulfitobacter sp. M22]MCF7777161.1 L,D-transpeptidase family protein [Sulfitobacter sp. M220]|tara:strand:- start:5744 stop:7372 length:1629 start_codon:yes stop_codon:yes gene_type:complete
MTRILAIQSRKFRRLTGFLGAAATALTLLTAPQPVFAQVTAFKQAVAEAAARDEDIAAYYRTHGYAPIWTEANDTQRARRAALMSAIRAADLHGLPVARYDPQGLMETLKAAQTPRDRGLAEVEMTRVFLQYARDLQTGVLVPSRIDPSIVREVPYRDRQTTLTDFIAADPTPFLRNLRPNTMEYNALMREKLRMEQLLSQGGWGPAVPASSLKPGAQGAQVVALRNRLMSMGYLKRSNVMTYDATLQDAVLSFQKDHGLNEDGVAGPSTMAEINKTVETRLQSVIVAMERERWLNKERGARHILVNIPAFTASVVDNGLVTFETRTVVGANESDRLTPEFSDVMEYIVINPTWTVPRSIVTKEYLPSMKRNPNAAGHIDLIDGRGRIVSRGSVNFSRYTERTFPYGMRQKPGRSNALGLVKFIFPNKYNIYLHDTPSKSLFSRDVRAFSHGCVRLADPFDFAYTLLAAQTADPVGYFKRQLATGRETFVHLDKELPVHLIYRTAFTTPRGHTQYRADIYGRDGRIWDALSKAGVALGAVQG